ncbi:MAG: ABC transporter substrate-binding protein [Desulfarculaceae bacterium]|nr:ABC transporter substrate-binding protein [Desulfarculaceae bacterium]
MKIAHITRGYLAACLALALVLCASWPARALDKVSLQLQWVHQAQFAGFYVAQDTGLYRQAGLEVDIRPGGPDVNPLHNLASLGCDFATGWLSEAVVLRSKEVPLVNLAQLIQRSALLLVTFRDSGIDSIKDLNNRRVGLWRNQFSVPTRALFKRNKIIVREIAQRTSVAPFLSRAVDAAMAMLYNEYHALYQAGVDLDQLKYFAFDDLGLNFPEDGLYTLEETWEERREVCRRFVAASLEGWRRAFAQEDAALNSVMKRVNEANLASNRPHQRWMLAVMKKLYTHRVGLDKLGELSPEGLKQVNLVLLEQGFIPSPVEAEGFVVRAWQKK